MGGVAEYVLSITAAAFLCAIVKHIVDDTHSAGRIIKTVSGIFMAVTLLSPVVDFSFDSVDHLLDDFQASAESVTESGTEMAGDAMSDIIKQRTEAYILDEVERLGLHLQAEVILSDAMPPIPIGVTVTGQISPYYKKILSQFISTNIGISGENLRWI